MKQNHSHFHSAADADDAVTSVVGEMLLLAIGIILVAVFAVSLMNILPGERGDFADVAMQANISADTIAFWHKGGDAIDGSQLSVLVYSGTNLSVSRQTGILSLTDAAGTSVPVFDLGGCLKVKVPGLAAGDQVRLTTGRSIIYSGEVTP